MRGKGSLLLIKSVLKRPKPEFGCSFMTNFIQRQTQRCPQTWQALLGPGRGEAFLASRSKMERTVRYTALQKSPRPLPPRPQNRRAGPGLHPRTDSLTFMLLLAARTARLGCRDVSCFGRRGPDRSEMPAADGLDSVRQRTSAATDQAAEI